MHKFTRSEWSEVALGGLVASLAAWIVWHALGDNGNSGGGSVSYLPPVAPIQSSPAHAPSIKSPSLPSLGYPPTKLPTGCSGCSGGCASGGGCGPGSTMEPTISAIVGYTNAAIAKMNQMAYATTQQLAAIGNSNPNNDLITYEAVPVS